MSLLSEKHIWLIGALGSGWYVSPGGWNLYKVQPGDSLQALAARYLGDAGRASEIWDMQSSGWQADHNNNMNALRSGDLLFMPQEAIDAAKAAGDAVGGNGEAPTVEKRGKTLDNGTDVLVPHGGGGGDVLVVPRPATPVTPVTPKPPPTPTPSSSGSMSLAAKIAIGAVSVAAAGGAVAYGVHHFKKTRRSNPRRRNPSRRRNGSVGGIDVERVRLNAGGYDSRGRYWGRTDEFLYSVYNQATGRYSHVRATSAKQARAKAAAAR